jgi:hypothetical protein
VTDLRTSAELAGEVQGVDECERSTQRVSGHDDLLALALCQGLLHCRKDGGSTLGMRVCEAVVDLHGGGHAWEECGVKRLQEEVRVVDERDAGRKNM